MRRVERRRAHPEWARAPAKPQPRAHFALADAPSHPLTQRDNFASKILQSGSLMDLSNLIIDYPPTYGDSQVAAVVSLFENDQREVMELWKRTEQLTEDAEEDRNFISLTAHRFLRQHFRCVNPMALSDFFFAMRKVVYEAGLK